MASKQELLARLEKITPLIGERAAQAEKDRKPDDDVMRALEETEIFKALVPKRYGGFELGLDTMTEATVIIARECMSTAQVAVFYIGHNLMMSRMSIKAQETVFTKRSYTMTPTAPGFTVRAKKVDGGFRVSGRGGWGTGIMHADWLLVMGINEVDDSPMEFLMPVTDVKIHDVWNMSGMSGTGSNEFTIDDVFVADHMTLPIDQFSAGNSPGALSHDNPMYHLPLMQAIYPEVIGLFVGGLQGMFESYQAIVKKHVAGWTGEQVSEKTATHLQLGDTYTKVWAAEVMMKNILNDVIANLGEEFTMDMKVNNKNRVAYLVRHCVDTVNQINLKCGTASFNLSSPTQRIARDMNTLATHAFTDWDISREQWGRVFTGLEPNNPLL